MTVRRAASVSMKDRNAGCCQSSSRWLTHQAGRTSAGPLPTLAYAMPAGEKRISCRSARRGGGLPVILSFGRVLFLALLQRREQHRHVAAVLLGRLLDRAELADVVGE